jgi:hypothetical protein
MWPAWFILSQKREPAYSPISEKVRLPGLLNLVCPPSMGGSVVYGTHPACSGLGDNAVSVVSSGKL